MRKLNFFAVAGVFAVGWTLFAHTAQAQTTITPHFTDQSKEVAIPADADVSPKIHDGMILVWYEYGKLAFVNTKGEYVFGTNFPINAINNLNYEDSHFSGGAAMVRKAGAEYAIIYPDGAYRDLPKDVSFASAFCDGYVRANKGTNAILGIKQGFINAQGSEVFPAITSTLTGTLGDNKIYPLRENRRVYFDAKLKKYGYADEKGAAAIKPQFDKALSFSDGLAAVMIEENYAKKWGFIDLAGKLVIPTTYNLTPGRFSEGLAAVRIGSDEYNYEMAYIDKTGKRVSENKTWKLNEFHNGYAFVLKELWKVALIDKNFAEVKDISKVIFPNDNGMGTLEMSNKDDYFGIDFPGGTQAFMNGNIGSGDIVSTDGTVIYSGGTNYAAVLYNPTEDGLIFCKVRMKNEPRLKKTDVTIPCFVNQKGEIVLYFQEGVEGFEGPTPVAKK
ncbi:hypothetical protein FACS189413_08350 [Bacteroidia bacterium]|nr:hypothetical protein FACS189413_08350 [Bacteroidia bacterium]